uniref:Uncharacterized protein n=1 Tax=Timema poppense TaxID=170557 RepID=A0A7R9CZR0_TIMPO|nr:unnamed protein product [Timema poppensis]
MLTFLVIKGYDGEYTMSLPTIFKWYVTKSNDIFLCFISIYEH